MNRCAVLAGGLAELIPTGAAMSALAAASLVASLSLTPALRRAAACATSTSEEGTQDLVRPPGAPQ